MDPLSILGAAGSALQIAQLICTLGKRILEKRKDGKSLKSIAEESKKYTLYLVQWGREMDGEAAKACKDLETILRQVTDEIDELSARTTLGKAWNAVQLRFHAPKFQAKLANAFQEFQLRMCIEGNRQSKKADDTLAELTGKLKDLQITAKTLESMPETSSAICRVEAQIASVSETIRTIERAINAVQQQVQDMQQIFTTSIVELVSSCIEKDGGNTRSKINEVIERMNKNDSTTRISAEILSDREPITWYGEGEEAPFMLWSLDGSDENGHPVKPAARFNGLELSTCPSVHTIDDIFGKRHAADEFDNNLSRMKRRRVKEVTPYVSLAEKDHRLHILREFMPPAIAERLSKEVPKDVLREALSMTRRLGQEYRYHLFCCIIKNQCSSIPKLVLLEELERGMLAVHADKLNVLFGFAVHHWSEREMIDYFFKVSIQISRTGYHLQVRDDVGAVFPGLIQTHSYDAEKRFYEDTMNTLHSKGSVGMSAILKACLSILNGKDEAGMEMAKFWGAIFPRITHKYLQLLFRGTWVETSKAGCWNSWKIETPSADLQFNENAPTLRTLVGPPLR